MSAKVNANQIIKKLQSLKCGTPDCNGEYECSKIARESAVLHGQQQTRIAELEQQLATSQRETQAAVDKSDELTKAFALACRIISDNFPACLPNNQSWQDYILNRVRTEPVCRVCGCTEDNACPGGCYWVEPDLCSACAQLERADNE